MTKHHHSKSSHHPAPKKPIEQAPSILDVQSLVGHGHPLDADKVAQCARAIKMVYVRAGIVVSESKNNSTARAIDDLSKHFHAANGNVFMDALEKDASHPAWPSFISKFTINHTAFLREPHHFDALKKFLKGRTGTPTIWCSAASTGEEPYSIVMAANEVGVKVRCIATDIDEKAIEKARAGVYDAERVLPAGEARVKQFFLRGTEKFKGKVKIKPEIAAQVEFSTFNLNDKAWPTSGPLAGPFDVIFCRNVMIYFDRGTQEKLMARFARVVKKDGLLMVGHSENVAPLTKEFKLLGQTVYTKA